MQYVYTFQSENFYFLSGEKKGTKNKILYYNIWEHLVTTRKERRTFHEDLFIFC